jgi:four helix bundle protein
MPPYFDHERLEVYQEAIAFVSWWSETGQTCSGPAVVKDQLDRASTSVPLNIAEGNGKSYPRDRCRYLETARGSALECAACLDVLVARRSLDSDAIAPGKEHLRRIVSMLVRLITSVSGRVSEERANYDPSAETDHFDESSVPD